MSVGFWWAGFGVFRSGFEFGGLVFGGRNCYNCGGLWVLMVAE